MANVPLGITTHAQKVCSLYKKALRNLESFYDRRFFKFYLFENTLKGLEIINLITRNDAEGSLAETPGYPFNPELAATLTEFYSRDIHFTAAKNVYRYQAVLLRERFDKNAKLADMRKAAQLLKEGEEELFLKQHPIPKKFATSVGGVAHERIVTPPDWVLDYWHPLEKAQYPEYFKRREERKKEFIAMWEKEYGKPDPKDQHH